jgi:hypothetical protein
VFVVDTPEGDFSPGKEAHPEKNNKLHVKIIVLFAVICYHPKELSRV